MMFQVFHKAKLFLKIVIPTFFGVEIPFIFTYEMTLRIDLMLGFFIAWFIKKNSAPGNLKIWSSWMNWQLFWKMCSDKDTCTVEKHRNTALVIIILDLATFDRKQHNIA